MSKQISIFTMAATLALTTSACKMVRNMDEMHDSTQKMSGTTEKMAQTTETMSKTTDKLLDATEGMLEDTRPAFAKTAREVIIESMMKKDSMEAKLSESAALQYAFEFQKWNPRMETQQEREILFAKAVREYVRNAREYLNIHISDLDDAKVSAAKKDEEHRNLYAYVATMHKIDDTQLLKAQEEKFQPVSLFDILANGLRENAEVAHGMRHESELSLSAQAVGSVYQDVIYLMQVRMNFLAAMPLSAVSKIASEKLLGLSGKLTGLRMLVAPWEARVEDLTVVQFRDYATMINKARETRDLLMSIGVAPKADKKVAKIYLNMKLDAKSAKAVGPASQAAVEDFKLSIEALLGQKLRQ
ncbi:MAG: hypothetical protein JNL01_16415 [Bdellovibrionales bacterium]|nr:hypothetical protein [Bdellovibrionales bacterium]